MGSYSPLAREKGCFCQQEKLKEIGGFIMLGLIHPNNHPRSLGTTLSLSDFEKKMELTRLYIYTFLHLCHPYYQIPSQIFSTVCPVATGNKDLL